MDLQLKNKRALITGSSRGLGYAIARTLAMEGCHVAINGRNSQTINEAATKLISETKANIIALAGDVGQPKVPAWLIEQTVNWIYSLLMLVDHHRGNLKHLMILPGKKQLNCHCSAMYALSGLPFPICANLPAQVSSR
jgi:NAD(P)-dependent dehydrogenase (short-subunit alcohol dehydrogenase family)